MFSLLVGLAWGAIGWLVFFLSFLDVRGWVCLVPLLLLVASGLAGLAALRLYRPTADGRPPRGVVGLLGLAVICALGYSALGFALEFGNFQSLDPGTVVFGIVPGVIALLVFIEALYLLLARLTASRG